MKTKGSSRALLYIALSVVVTVVVWGFFLIGSPSFNRKISADRNRIEDLQSLRNDVERYYEEQKKLPEQLANLDKLNGYQRALEDPTTKKQYVYKINGTYSYELCADFELTSLQAGLEKNRYETNEDGWTHEAGQQCFKFDIPAGKRKK